MPSNPQRKLPFQPARPAYRTLRGWALGTLIEQGAVVECEHHGHCCDRADPDGLEPGSRGSLAEPVPGHHAGSVHCGDGRGDAGNRRYLP
jgi:hypothetical protein